MTGQPSQYRCRFIGKMEYAETIGGKLMEVHICKNKKIEFIYCETAIKFGLCASHSAIQQEPTINSVLTEIEEGLSTYENEHKNKQVCDRCLGIYIPINVVRRLIEVRKQP